MVARLQQLIVFGWLVLAAGWGVWWWPRSPLVACFGIVGLSLAHSAVLAIEFIASRHVSTGDPLPRATSRQCVRAWWAESRIALQVFCFLQPFRSRAIPDHLSSDKRRGVVLVHGFMCNRGFWNPWLRLLRSDGRVFVAVNLEPVLGPIDAYVPTLDQAITQVSDATGQPPLVVCHSMGGLAARAWLRMHDGARVQRIVTIGTPHAGTWLARFGHTANGRQMRMGTEWLTQMASEGTSAQKVPFTCWYSDCDNVVFPISTATLPNADNRPTGARGHVEMAFDARVQRETFALLDQP
ncbi:MAG: alpha/beta fold hydrolase [Variovorax sp.]|nr:MAG: alpha/beta fold hydrolase [Variovorax sp.]